MGAGSVFLRRGGGTIDRGRRPVDAGGRGRPARPDLYQFYDQDVPHYRSAAEERAPAGYRLGGGIAAKHERAIREIKTLGIRYTRAGESFR